jgi:hypothetical protein
MKRDESQIHYLLIQSMYNQLQPTTKKDDDNMYEETTILSNKAKGNATTKRKIKRRITNQTSSRTLKVVSSGFYLTSHQSSLCIKFKYVSL